MSSDDNPYQAPSTIEPAGIISDDLSSMLRAQRMVRCAGLIGLTAPLFELLWYLLEGLTQRTTWHVEAQADFVPTLVLSAGGIMLLLAAIWWLAYPVVYKLSALFHGLIGRWISLPKWQRATDKAAWRSGLSTYTS